MLEVDARAHRMVIQTRDGARRELDLAYVAGHLEHAYALTGHSAQGSTVGWAGVIGRPAEFSREWAYTVLSRARGHTTLHVIAEPSAEEGERQRYAPAEPPRTADEALGVLERRMRQTEAEFLALERDQLRAAIAPSRHQQEHERGLRNPAPSVRIAPLASARLPTVQR